MNKHWSEGAKTCPLVEFHDLRVEAGQAGRYLALLDERLGPSLALEGVRDLGHFHVRGQPDRLVLLRGYRSSLERRKALGGFFAGAAWQRHRAEATGLVREHSVILSRAVRPEGGIRSLRPGDRYRLVTSELRFAEQIGSYHLWLRLLLRKAGLDPVAAFATLESRNDVVAVPVVRDRTHHLALVRTDAPIPDLPADLRDALRFAPEVVELQPALSLVW